MKLPFGMDSFDAMIVLLYLLYAGLYFGLYLNAPYYIFYLKMIIKIYVGLFLMVQFNPWTDSGKLCTPLDKKIAFNSGIFVMQTLFF